jgi:hypothetical protein
MRWAAIAIMVILMASYVAPPVSAEIVTNPVLVSGLENYDITGTTLSYGVTDHPGYAISELRVSKIAPDHPVFITLVQASGNTITGQFCYESVDLLTARMNLTLGSSRVSWTQLAPAKLNSHFRVCYADDTNSTLSGLAMTDLPPFNQGEDKIAFFAVPYTSSDPIVAVTVTSSDTITLRVTVAPSENVASSVSSYSKASSGGFLSDMISFVAEVWSVITLAISVFKFIFVDHFLAILALYESVLIAYAAHSSRNIIAFARLMVRYNERLFTVFFKFVFGLVTFFYNIIRAVKPI